MILCTAISHCLCDGIGTSQFLHAWAHFTRKPKIDPPVIPFHTRHVLNPRSPPQVNFPHPGYTKNTPTQVDLIKLLQSQPVVPTSFIFTPVDVLSLKKQCVPSLKCTTFEALATHTWRSWVRSLDLNPTLNVKLLFSVNIRRKLNPEMPEGYYGNGFVLGCAESTVKDLIAANMRHSVKLVQQAKETLDDEHVRSMVDLLDDKTVKTDLSTSLVISQWSKLGLEEVDFGEGKPLHLGSLVSDIYCLFLPVIGDSNAVRVQVSVPESVAEKFEYYMRKSWQNEENGDVKNGYHHAQEDGLI